MVETRLDWTALFVNASCWNLTKPLLQENQATLTETNPEDRTPVAGRHLRCIFGDSSIKSSETSKTFFGHVDFIPTNFECNEKAAVCALTVLLRLVRPTPQVTSQRSQRLQS